VNHSDWVMILGISAVVGLLSGIMKQLEKIGAQVAELCGQLSELNDRQQLIRDSVHSISVETSRMPKQPRYYHLGGQL
jgi:hypothetical protein